MEVYNFIQDIKYINKYVDKNSDCAIVVLDIS